MPEQFGIPSKIIHQVMSGESPPSAYSPYMKELHGKNVIGINAAYLLGNWMKVIFFGDKGFFEKNRKQLLWHPSLKVTCADKKAYDYKRYSIKVLLRDQKKTGISSNRKTVCWNNNSGAASISLARHLGAKRIYLLGFDMKPNDKQMSHWHHHYHGKVIRENVFRRHLNGWPDIVKDAGAMGIEIINVSPDSAIDCLPKVKLRDVL